MYKGKRIKEMTLSERKKAYEDVMELHKSRGWGKRRIARELDLNEDSIKGWLYYDQEPSTCWNEPDLSPSPELSYVLGVYWGDGCATIDHSETQSDKHRIKLSTTDRDFAEEFGKCLRSLIGREREPAITNYEKEDGICYESKICSKILLDFLERPLNEHKPKIEKHPSQFVRAFFDSEGNVYQRCTSRGTLHRGWYLRTYNTNRMLTEYISELLDEHFSITSSIRTKAQTWKGEKPVHVLEIFSIEDVKKFRNEIGFSIQRKKEKLEGAELESPRPPGRPPTEA